MPSRLRVVCFHYLPDYSNLNYYQYSVDLNKADTDVDIPIISYKLNISRPFWRSAYAIDHAAPKL